MKRTLLLILCCCALLDVFTQPVRTLRLVCDETADLSVAVECLKLLETRLPVRVEIVRMPWKRCLEIELKQGLAGGAFLASYQPAREEFGAYPKKDGQLDIERRYNYAGYFFYRRKDSPVRWDGTTISGLQRAVGAPRGYSVVQDLRNAGYTVEESSDTLSDLLKLDSGRIDLVAAVEEKADQVLAARPELGRRIEKISVPYTAKPYFLMLSHQFVRADPLLAERIWDAVRSIRETEYLEIYRRFSGEP